jgi:hypothetical protein
MEIIRDSIGLLQRLERSNLLRLLSHRNAADGVGEVQDMISRWECVQAWLERY